MSSKNIYAIVQAGATQFKVSEGDVIEIDFIPEEETVVFESILAVGNGESMKFGTPYVEGARVSAKILGDILTKKIRVAKFKAKSNYHKVQGHRSVKTQVKIESISA